MSDQKQAILIIVLAPLVYTLCLWSLMNWLIMGDWLYFVRSLWRWHGEPSAATATLPGPVFVHYIAAALCVIVLAACARKRDRAGVYLSVVSLGSLVLAQFLAGRGLLWATMPVLFSLFPLCLLTIGYVLGHAAAVPRVLHWPVFIAPVVMMAASLAGFAMAAVAPKPRQLPLRQERDVWLPRIAHHVMARSEFSKVFVCGYEGLALVGPHEGRVFVYALDFDFGKAGEDFPGHDLYVLVRRPEGRSRMESIHWKYDGIYALGHRTTLYDGDWAAWRLFEVIQAPRRRQGGG